MKQILKILKKYKRINVCNKFLVFCKFPKCGKSCAGDIGYCLEHYPDVCEQCDHICNKNDKYDKLNTNSYYKFNN